MKTLSSSNLLKTSICIPIFSLDIACMTSALEISFRAVITKVVQVNPKRSTGDSRRVYVGVKKIGIEVVRNEFWEYGRHVAAVSPPKPVEFWKSSTRKKFENLWFRVIPCEKLLLPAIKFSLHFFYCYTYVLLIIRCCSFIRMVLLLFLYYQLSDFLVHVKRVVLNV